MPPKPIKRLIHRATKRDDTGAPRVFFTNAKVKDLKPGHQSTVWFLDHQYKDVYPQKHDIILCIDGTLKAGNKGDPHPIFHRVTKLPSFLSAPGGLSQYHDWLHDYREWEAPISLEIGETIKLHVPGGQHYATLRTIAASDVQLGRLSGNLHFTEEGQPIPFPSPDTYFLTRQGNFWQWVGDKLDKCETKPQLIHPPPLVLADQR